MTLFIQKLLLLVSISSLGLMISCEKKLVFNNDLEINGTVALQENQALKIQSTSFSNEGAKLIGCENSCLYGDSCAFIVKLTNDPQKLIEEVADGKTPVCAVKIGNDNKFSFTISKENSKSNFLITIPLNSNESLKAYHFHGNLIKGEVTINSLSSLQAPIIAAHLNEAYNENQKENKFYIISSLRKDLTLEKIENLIKTMVTEVYSLSLQRFYLVQEMSQDARLRELLINENAVYLNQVRLNKVTPNTSESLASWKEIALVTEAEYEADPNKYCFDVAEQNYLIRGEKVQLDDTIYYRRPFVEYGETCGDPVKKIHTCNEGSFTPDPKIFPRYQVPYCQVLRPDCSIHQHGSCSLFENFKVLSHASGSYEIGGVMKLTGTCPNNHKILISFESETVPRQRDMDLGRVDCINGEFNIELTATDTTPKKLIFNLVNSSNQSLEPVYIPNIEIKKSTPVMGTDSLSNSYYVQDFPNDEEPFDIPSMAPVLRQTVAAHFPESCTPFNLFSSYSSTGSSVWAPILPNASLDFSGVVWSTTLAGTLVTKRHIVYATHYAHQIGGSVTFTDRNGLAVQRTITDKAVVFGDVSVALLNDDVPSSVRVYRVPHPKVRDFSGALTIVTNQDREVWVGNAQLNYPFYLLSDNPYFSVSSDSNSSYSTCFKAVRGGDSGNPDFFVMEDRLVLASTKHMSGHSGPYFGNRELQKMLLNSIKAINQKNSLDPAAGFLSTLEKND